MAYQGYGGGGPQRPYPGPAAQRPPPQQYGAPQSHDGYQDSYGYEDYNQGYGQDYGGQYQDQGYSRAPPPHSRGGRPPPPRGGGGYPPRGGGGRGPPPGRGIPNGPSPGRGGGRHGPYQDPAGGRRPPMDNPPVSPRDPKYGGGGYQEQQMADQMSNMNISGPGPRRPGGRSSGESQRHQGPYGQPPLDGGRGTPGRNYPPQGNADPRRGPAPGQAPGPPGHYDDGYGGRPQRKDIAPLERSMTMPEADQGGRQRMPPPQRTETLPYNGPASQGMASQPQKMYPQENRGPAPGQNRGEYNDNSGYGQQSGGSHQDGYGSYYDQNGQEYPAPGHSSQSSAPNFDAPQGGRGSFEQTMRPGPGNAQPGPRQTAQLNHAKSQPDLRQPQAAVFEMAGDAPSVPAVPQMNAYGGGYDRGPNTPVGGGYDQMPPRGPSAPPGPINGMGPQGSITPRPGTDPSQSRGHPAPVRPGLMSNNSAVRVNERPPPVRNYGGVPQGQPPPTQAPQQRPQQHSRPQQQYTAPPQNQQAPAPPPQPQEPETPVTTQELEQLRMVIKNNPNDQGSALRLAKRLIEAADVLVPGLPDPKSRARARERYVMDANKILKKLSNAQNPDAMFVLADSLGRGLFGNEPDSKEAFTLYQSAAKLGHAPAAYRTAVCCEIGNDDGGGTRKDPLKAIQWYKRAATLGDPPAMYKVGMIMLKGLLGQPRNPREAVSWLKRAAERADAENPHALHELGLLYESASGNDVIIRDQAYALELFNQAADLGYKFSQYRLGAAHEYGLMGCPIEPRLSIMWYSRAATQEEHQSELALSGWYLTGSEGVLGQSDTEAYLWARKAAIAGLAKAEYAMGYFTEVGIGVPTNMEDAKRWYWRAAAQDFPKARERLEELKRAGRSVPRQRERISRGRIERQQEGDCTVM